MPPIVVRRWVVALIAILLLGLSSRAFAGTVPGLTAEFYNDPNIEIYYGLSIGRLPYFDSLALATNFFNNITPTATVVTTAGGKSNLDFSNDSYQSGVAPFGQTSPDSTQANYGFTGTGDFEALFTGYINVASAGVATFSTTSANGSVLFIGTQDTPVVDNNAFQGETTVSGTYDFTAAGLYPITIGYYQQQGSLGLLVQWTPPGGSSLQTISNSDLSTTALLADPSAPEPTTLGLLGFATLGLLGRRRR